MELLNSADIIIFDIISALSFCNFIYSLDINDPLPRKKMVIIITDLVGVWSID